jgi:hypothetical protein
MRGGNFQLGDQNRPKTPENQSGTQRKRVHVKTFHDNMGLARPEEYDEHVDVSGNSTPTTTLCKAIERQAGNGHVGALLNQTGWGVTIAGAHFHSDDPALQNLTLIRSNLVDPDRLNTALTMIRQQGYNDPTAPD